MKKPTTILTAAVVLSAPALGAAQVYEHVPNGLGFAPSHYPDPGQGFGIGLVRPASGIAFQAGGGLSFGFGFGFGLSLGVGIDVLDYGYGGYLHDAYPLPPATIRHCPAYHWLGHVWLDPFHPWGGCHGPAWFNPWWQPVVFNPWPPMAFGWHSHGSHASWWHSPGWHSHGWFGHSPYWGGSHYDPWGYAYHGHFDSWGHGGWDRHWGRDPYRYDRGGYVSDRGYAQPRYAGRSPLFGPRYKEDPRPSVYVSDNGPERPVSRAVPRVERTVQPSSGLDVGRSTASRTGGAARTESGNRTARPRVRARPETGSGSATPVTSTRPRTRSGGPVVTPGSQVRTSRPDAKQATPATGARSRGDRPVTKAPTRTRTAKPSVGRATLPVGRVTPPTSRATPPTVRTRPSATPPGRAASSRPAPSTRVRSAPSRSTPPKVRSAPSRTSPPKARSAPARSTPPKARSAPPRNTPPKARSAPPRTRSAPARASSAPRRSPPKSSPPRRSAPPRRGK